MTQDDIATQEEALLLAGAHSHSRCDMLSDPERGHDHECEIVIEPCDDFECVSDVAAKRQAQQASLNTHEFNVGDRVRDIDDPHVSGTIIYFEQLTTDGRVLAGILKKASGRRDRDEILTRQVSQIRLDR
jgi:hypothetical protein